VAICRNSTNDRQVTRHCTWERVMLRSACGPVLVVLRTQPFVLRAKARKHSIAVFCLRQSRVISTTVFAECLRRRLCVLCSAANACRGVRAIATLAQPRRYWLADTDHISQRSRGASHPVAQDPVKSRSRSTSLIRLIACAWYLDELRVAGARSHATDHSSADYRSHAMFRSLPRSTNFPAVNS